MASTPQNFLIFLFLVVVVSTAAAGRINPTNAEKQPQWLGQYDGTVFIPGMGRFMVPKKGQTLLHHNPITGAPTASVSIPDIGGSTGMSAPRHYIPGGDDTLLPNPGVEVPIPSGGSVPTPSHN